MMVKICGITRREDAEAAVAAGADAIGFIFVPSSPRFVTPQQAAELGEGLDVWKVGVFTGQPVESAFRTARLDIAQIYGSEIPAVPRIWRAVRVGQSPWSAGDVEAVLLDGPANGVPFDWSQARNAAAKVIIAGGLTASNVAQAIRAARPWGVDASSSLESSPGIKDPETIRRFIAAAREAA
jgi:phosphoribosylanthranilate isomerase